jgi:predicted PurR-regulated permease PerM
MWRRIDGIESKWLSLGGVVGVLLAIPAAAVIQITVTELFFRTPEV